VRPFPSEFLWGATLSAHSVEGGHFDSDWWRWEQRPGRIAGESTSQAGSDHWNRFREDIGLARLFGLNALLVSLEWSRIEPREGHVDGLSLEHYRAVLEAMCAEGLEPVVALHEVTVPAWFALRGGWLAAEAAEIFSRYAGEVAGVLGEACRYWIPMLTPVTALRMGYMRGLWPPGARNMWAAWKSLRHMALAHAETFRRFREKVPDARIGLSVHAETLRPFDVSSSWDLRAARGECALSNTVWPRVLTSGQWPRPFGENRALADTADFIGVSYYGAQYVRFRPGKGTFAVRVNNQGERAGVYDCEQDSDGLAGVLHDLAAFRKPLMVLGTGLATEDDRARRHFLLNHVATAQRALANGTELRGFMYRSLLDGFEWDRGYEARYGLVHVGRAALARTPNPSAYLYKDIAVSGGIQKGTLARYSPDWRPPEGLVLA